jgi:hypothetical protein
MLPSMLLAAALSLLSAALVEDGYDEVAEDVGLAEALEVKLDSSSAQLLGIKDF